MSRLLRASRSRVTRLALVVASALTLTAATPSPQGYLAGLSGSVEIGSGEPPSWRAASEGDPLAAHESVRTGSDGRAELHLPTGTVRLYPSSLLRLASDHGDTRTERLELERGSSLFDVLKRSGDETFQVETRDAVLVVKGTRFSVSVDGQRSSMAVFRGLVGVRALAQSIEREIQVRPGFGVVGGTGAPFELVVSPERDPWEGWSKAQPAPVVLMQRNEQPPAKLAVDLARDSAMHSARPEFAEHAEQLRGEPVEGGKEQPEADAETKPAPGGFARHEAREMAVKALSPGTEPPAIGRGKADASELPQVEPGIDALQGKGSAVMGTVHEQYIESVLSGGTGTAGSTFQVELLNGSGQPGPDRVHISGPSIDQTLTKQEVSVYLATGTEIFSPDLLTLLNTQNVDPVQFAHMLQNMF